jgi:microcystin-dependent protein
MKTQSMTRLLGAAMLLALGASIAPQQAHATPFLGEMRWVAFSFPPKGWAACNGQVLPINQNQALFSLLGTTYGGNGTTTFALPDMQSRAPIHVSATHALGTRSGEENHTLTLNEIPSHSHSLKADPQEATAGVPGSTLYLAKTSTGTSAYGATAGVNALAPDALAAIGSSQPHENMKPFITLNCVIALQGIFPSRN